MSVVKWPVFPIVLVFLWAFDRGDAEVSCVFMESCILPCSFQASDEEVIHWVKEPGNTAVHSYYYDQDQFKNQDQSFKGRTSLFPDQISRGNASLKLTGVKVQDQGKYKCYTSTIAGNKELFISINVEAPVSEVDIQQVENRIICSSQGIYPEPELTWSTSPPSNMPFNYTTTAQQTEQQLYNIISTLIPPDSTTNLIYSCTVSSQRSRRKATLFKPNSISSGKEATVSCSAPSPPLTSLIWRFSHSQIILTKTNSASTVSEEWKQKVKAVADSGELTLQDLTQKQEGIYTCKVSNAEETFISNTFLRIEGKEVSAHGVAIAAGVMVAFILIGLAVFVVLYKKKMIPFCQKKRKGGTRNEGDTKPAEVNQPLKYPDDEHNV